MADRAWETELRINALIAESEQHSARRDFDAALGAQRHAADLARDLVSRSPQDARWRQGLGSLLYRHGALLLAVGEPAAAVSTLDEAERVYADLVGTVPEMEFFRADVLARRGLARSVAGRAVSAAVDADEAVITYLSVTGGDPRHPKRHDLARVLAMNAAILARHGDPDLAISSANAALGYFGYPGSDGADQENDTDDTDAENGADSDGYVDAQDSGYVHSAATVSALLNFTDGRVAEGFLPAVVVFSNLRADDLPRARALETDLRLVDELLVAGRSVPYPLDYGRELARKLLPVVRGRGLLWVPPDEWVERGARPTLAAVLRRHAADGSELDVQLSYQDSLELLWTGSMRWLPALPLATVLRLAELAVEVLPRSYADGLRLALDAHLLFATAHRRRAHLPTPDRHEYGQPWLRLLTVAAEATRATGDDELAADFAGWITAVR
ncbi:hypothetical protein O7632_28145 [Solwaraspora sp. WMMD406]|uniref:hypothetical protein n=1 Tax=Solwaraspora sp. WMMD406 TaxID=3016095 RepID=UPI00241680CC|nr:hypothetical protein [Solwaraspora sp. WMMD406]MDG4767935.1 hypothetical protein [Solwaraspora sp. WMMD406]